MRITVSIRRKYSLCLQEGHNLTIMEKTEKESAVVREWGIAALVSVRDAPGVTESGKCPPETQVARGGAGQLAGLTQSGRKWGEAGRGAPWRAIRLGVILAAEITFCSPKFVWLLVVLMQIIESRKSQRGNGKDEEIFILAITTGRRRGVSVPVGWWLNCCFTLLTSVSPVETGWVEGAKRVRVRVSSRMNMNPVPWYLDWVWNLP